MSHHWPGNIRELENLVKRYVSVGNESQIIRELTTHKPLIASSAIAPAAPGASAPNGGSPGKARRRGLSPPSDLGGRQSSGSGEAAAWLGLLEIGRQPPGWPSEAP